MKDLDELEQQWKECGNIDETQSPLLIAELRAARSVIDASREIVRIAMLYDLSPLGTDDLHEALSFYDHVREEAKRGHVIRRKGTDES